MSDEEVDPEFKPRKRGRPGRKKIVAPMTGDGDEMTDGTPSKSSPQKPFVPGELTYRRLF